MSEKHHPTLPGEVLSRHPLPSRSKLTPPLWLRRRLARFERIVLRELIAFGLVGALSFLLDVVTFTVFAPHGALKAKCISTVVSTTFAYFGNKYFSFSPKAREKVANEALYFFLINGVVLLFSELVLGASVYLFSLQHDGGAVFFINVGTIILGTGVRFVAYKRFVFPSPQPLDVVE